MRIATVFAAAMMATVSVAGVEHAQASIQHYQLNIPRQTLDTALKDLAQQTGLQIGRFSGKVDGSAMVGPVKGEQTPGDALDVLLAHTGLNYKIVSDTIIAVYNPKDTSPSGGSSALISQPAGEGMQIADSSSQSSPLSSPDTGGGRDGASPSPQSGEGRDEDISEIIVSAQKRQERLQDVPIAISVLSGEKLDAFTGGGVSDALAYLPGITLNESTDAIRSNGTSFISMRGVSASGSLAAGASPTAVYIDGVPYGFAKNAIFPNIAPYDLNRVEVLRGPHGSLYGANALNGVVRVLTHDANLDDFELKTRVSTSAIKGGAETYGGDAAINLPLVPGKLAARAVLGYSSGGGWIDDLKGKNINDSENVNARLKLKAQPTDRLSLGLSGWLSRDHNGAPNVSNDDDFYRGTRNAGEAKATIDFNVVGLEAGYDFPGFTATSMTSYIDYASATYIDASALLPPGLDDLYHKGLDSNVFSQEINLVSRTKGSWRWSAGAYYRDAEDRDRHNRQAIIIPRPIDFKTTSQSFAVYGELTRLFLDGKVELTGGLRYFEDQGQDSENLDFDGVGPLIVRPKKTYTKVTPRAVLTWHAADKAMFYTSYGEGFRSGGDQYPTLTSFLPDFPAFKPDSLKNYEIGAKGSLLDGRLVYEAAAFFIDWQDIQQGLRVLNPLLTGGPWYFAIANGDSASGTGFEIATSFMPVKGLNLSASYSKSNLTSDNDVITPGGAVLIPNGSRLPYSPEYTLSGEASYSFPIGITGLGGRLSAGASYSPSIFAVTLTEGSSAVILDGESTITSRANFELSSNSGWAASLFVENLTDDRRGGILVAPNHPFNPSRQPRVIGLQFEYRY